jgi:hypothetical protein
MRLVCAVQMLATERLRAAVGKRRGGLAHERKRVSDARQGARDEQHAVDLLQTRLCQGDQMSREIPAVDR